MRVSGCESPSAARQAETESRCISSASEARPKSISTRARSETYERVDGCVEPSPRAKPAAALA